ncbi:Mycobacterium rhizamassiliense ORFan, partial [Mycobacterium rhizamassiliense]
VAEASGLGAQPSASPNCLAPLRDGPGPKPVPSRTAHSEARPRSWASAPRVGYRKRKRAARPTERTVRPQSRLRWPVLTSFGGPALPPKRTRARPAPALRMPGRLRGHPRPPLVSSLATAELVGLWVPSVQAGERRLPPIRLAGPCRSCASVRPGLRAGARPSARLAHPLGPRETCWIGPSWARRSLATPSSHRLRVAAMVPTAARSRSALVLSVPAAPEGAG